MIDQNKELNCISNNEKVHSNFSTGISYCVLSSLFLTLIIEVVLFMFTLGESQTLYEAFFILLSSLLFFGLIIGLITFINALVIGVPTVVVLSKLGSDTRINSGLVGVLSTSILLLILFSGNYEWQFLIIILYGFVSGFAFMHGYKKGVKA